MDNFDNQTIDGVEAQLNFMYGEYPKVEGTFSMEGNFGDLDLDVVVDKLRWLEALEQAGVDNWEGIDLAEDIYLAFKTPGDGCQKDSV